MDIPTILPPGNEGVPTTPGPAGALTGGQNLGQEDFLLMLVTQLNNQDPLNPLEGHEFAAQLAQFTSVEQLLSLNDTLAGQSEMFTLLAETMGESLVAQGEMLSRLADSLNRSAATDLIGLSVDVPGNAVIWDGSTPAAPAFELTAPAASVRVTIRNEHGEPVRTLTLEDVQAGLHNAPWDGLDADGQPLPEGVYTFDIQATDADGNPVGTTALMQGIVDRVGFGPEGVVVWVNGQPVPYHDIRSIGWPSDDVVPTENAPADTAPEDGVIETPTPHTST